MSKKYVYLFSEGNASMRNLLGGKGANLAEMIHLGLPVPLVLLLQLKLVVDTMKKVRKSLLKSLKKSLKQLKP